MNKRKVVPAEYELEVVSTLTRTITTLDIPTKSRNLSIIAIIVVLVMSALY